MEADDAGLLLILKAVWNHGYDAVAAGDFEDELRGIARFPRYR